VPGIDQAGVGGPGGFDPWTGIIQVLIEGNGNRDKTIVT